MLVLTWRPALATSFMALAMAGLDALGAPTFIVIPVGLALFVAVLWRIGGVTADDLSLLRRLRPSGAPIDGEPDTGRVGAGN